MLGPVEVTADGERLAVPAGRTTELLVRLALDAGTAVRAERLIDDLWSDAGTAGTHAAARNALQTTVSRLRRALGDGALVTGTAAGYRLAVEPQAVDALAVAELARRAARRRAAGDATATVTTCARALDLFRGDPLTGAGDGDWLVPHRVRLAEIRLSLIETDLAARLDLGAGSELIGELEELVHLHPLREGLWASLMLALYRQGRQADALAAFTRLRTHLAEELGLVPSPALADLERRILGHDPDLTERADSGSPAPLLSVASPLASVPEVSVPVASSPVISSPGGAEHPTNLPTNLPTLVSSLVGREADAARAATLLAAQPLVTLTGPAGVGKTRLAIEVARQARHADGVWLVRLEAARDQPAVIEALAEAMGMIGGDEAAVERQLRGSDALLVLDNCEQIVGPVGNLVVRLLQGGTGLRLLATSQRPLGLDGEAVCPIDPLPLAASVALFTQRAAMHRRSFGPGEADLDTVEAVCRSLDGLPLAIELAAARTATLSVAEITRRLNDRFALLSDPTGRRPERHRALRAAIAWSYDLLEPDDQRVLWALAPCPGGARLEEVEAVAAAVGVDPVVVLDNVGRLVDRSLVSVEVVDEVACYRLLDSVRAFALDRLIEAGMSDAALAAHASWIASAADRAGDGVRGPDQGYHLALIRAERVNIDQAVDWAAAHDPALGLRIANGFGWSWFVLGDGPFGAERLRRALTATDRDPTATAQGRAENLRLSAWLSASNDIELARADAEKALRIAQEHNDDRLEARCRVALGFVLLQLGQPREVLAVLDRCVAGPADPEQRWEECGAWRLMAHANVALGDLTAAARACDQAELLARGLGDDWVVGHLENLLGIVARAQGRLGDATGHLRSAAAASRRLGFQAAEALHLTNLARSLGQAGDRPGAVVAYHQAIDAARVARDFRIVALAQLGLGRALRSEGDQAGADAALRAADSWFRTSGGGDGATLAACLVAALDAQRGDPGAGARLGALVELGRAEGDRQSEIVALDALALLNAVPDRATAEALLDTADRLLADSPMLVDDADRVDARAARALLAERLIES